MPQSFHLSHSNGHHLTLENEFCVAVSRTGCTFSASFQTDNGCGLLYALILSQFSISWLSDITYQPVIIWNGGGNVGILLLVDVKLRNKTYSKSIHILVLVQAIQ